MSVLTKQFTQVLCHRTQILTALAINRVRARPIVGKARAWAGSEDAVLRSSDAPDEDNDVLHFIPGDPAPHVPWGFKLLLATLVGVCCGNTCYLFVDEEERAIKQTVAEVSGDDPDHLLPRGYPPGWDEEVEKKWKHWDPEPTVAVAIGDRVAEAMGVRTEESG